MIDKRYSIVIQWSDDDQLYIASFPEWGRFCKTHGRTYEEAAKNADEVLNLLMRDGDQARPQPRLFEGPGGRAEIKTGRVRSGIAGAASKGKTRRLRSESQSLKNSI